MYKSQEISYQEYLTNNSIHHALHKRQTAEVRLWIVLAQFAKYTSFSVGEICHYNNDKSQLIE